MIYIYIYINFGCKNRTTELKDKATSSFNGRETFLELELNICDYK